MKPVLLTILVLTALSCASKRKVSTNTVEIKRDSISYVLPSDILLEVSNLCDSLDRPVDVLKTINTGASEASVQIKDNKLRVQVKTDTIFKEKIVYRDKLVEVDKEVVKWKIPMWVWYSYIGIFLVAVAYIRFGKYL